MQQMHRVHKCVIIEGKNLIICVLNCNNSVTKKSGGILCASIDHFAGEGNVLNVTDTKSCRQT